MKYDIESIKKRKKVNHRVKKIVFIFIIIMLYNVTLLYVSYIDKFETPNFYLYKAYNITTTSMLPTIKVDDVIIIKKCKKETDIKKGDIITYKIDGDVITHRVVEIIDHKDGSSLQFVTKGDNNNMEDTEYIFFDDIEGKLLIKIPCLGKIISGLKSGIVIILITLIVLIVYLNRIEAKEKSETRRKKKQIEDKLFLDK